MSAFRKIETVEARQYDGPRLVVIHDKLGEQTAVAGDWLLGTERGKIEVVSREKFATEFIPFDAEVEEPEVLALKAVVVSLQKQIDESSALNAELQTKYDSMDQSNAHWVAEVAKLQAQIDALTPQAVQAQPAEPIQPE